MTTVTARRAGPDGPAAASDARARAPGAPPAPAGGAPRARGVSSRAGHGETPHPAGASEEGDAAAAGAGGAARRAPSDRPEPASSGCGPGRARDRPARAMSAGPAWSLPVQKRTCVLEGRKPVGRTRRGPVRCRRNREFAGHSRCRTATVLARRAGRRGPAGPPGTARAVDFRRPAREIDRAWSAAAAGRGPVAGRARQRVAPSDDQTSIFVRTRATTSDVNSLVEACPPRSGVRTPAALASSTAS